MALPGRPGLNVVLANLVGAMSNDRRPLSNAMLERASELGPVVAAVEADDCTPATVLDPDLWAWSHDDHPLLDGTLWAWRRSSVQLMSEKWLDGCQASPANARRSIHRVRFSVGAPRAAWSLSASLAHVPYATPASSAARREMFANLHASQSDLFLGDMNTRRQGMRQEFPRRQLRGGQVMWMASRHDQLQVGTARLVDAIPGTRSDDHPLVRVHVSPR